MTTESERRAEITMDPTPAEKADWTPEQAATTGACHYCGDLRPLRMEPFGRVLACRTCWEQICYGEED